VAQLKKCSFHLSNQIGLTRRLATSVWRQQRLLVLCYHGVSLADEHRWNPELYISPATLSRRLDTLTRLRCAVLPLDEAVAGLYAGTLPPRAVTLTFDDGFYDFRARALPLLEARGYRATVYVATQHCESDPTITHLLASYLRWKHRRARSGAGTVRPARVLSVMTPSELADVSNRGVAVEMHTHRHRAPDDPDEFMSEVRLNRASIEASTGRRPRHLCYPSGIYRASYLPRLASDDIATATTCDPALASRLSHPLLLPRFVDSEACSQLAFEAWVTGVAMWLPRRTRRANARQ
jgi:peptidoglycan/xylan/chitin deacetylase (PgdA/CDA1 family)